MAISGDSPISAANLKAVVDKLMGGGYLPEVVGCQLNVESYGTAIYIVCEKDQYTRMELTACSTMYGKVTCSFKPVEGSYKLVHAKNPSASHTMNVKWLGDKRGGFKLSFDSAAVEAVHIIGYH